MNSPSRAVERNPVYGQLLMDKSPTKLALDQLPNSPEVWKAYESEEAGERLLQNISDLQKSPTRKKRRTSGDLRREHLGKRGAWFIDFDKPPDLKTSCFRDGVPMEQLPARVTRGSKNDKKYWNELQTVLRKGVLVTRDTGCLIPHPQFHTSGGGAKNKGYQRMARVMFGIAPSGLERTKDHRDWDITPQLSHTCHRHLCMNPAHLYIEEAWRNWKRNYCGDSGECDCGQLPKCLLEYRPNCVVEDLPLCESMEQVSFQVPTPETRGCSTQGVLLNQLPCRLRPC